LTCVFIGIAQFGIAQNLTDKQTHSVMDDDSTDHMAGWAQSLFGFRLSKGEQILHRDESVMVIGSEAGAPIWIVATYDFTPVQLPSELQVRIKSAHSLVINDVSKEPENNTNRIPEWVGALKEVQSLTIWYADLSDINLLNGFPIVYLDLRSAHNIDASSLIEVICSLKSLELFIYDKSIPQAIISSLKEKLTRVAFMQKE
jgi:hypothetical protein